MVLPNIPIVNAGSSYIEGLELTYQGGLNAFLLIAPGAARDSTNTNDIILPQVVLTVGGVQVPQTYNGAPLGAVINGLQVGANGVDVAPLSGSISSFYGVYIISDSTGYQPTAGILSLNEYNPLLPAGYDMYRRIGYCYGSNVLSAPVINHWYQFGTAQTRSYWYDIPITVTTITSPNNWYNLQNIFGVPALADQIFLEVSYKPLSVAGGIVDIMPYGSPIVTANPLATQPSVPGAVRVSASVVGVPQLVNVIVPGENNTLNVPPFNAILYRTTTTGDILVFTATGFIDFLP